MTLRYVRWNQMTMGSSTIRPEELPPTEQATYYHSLRVHLQVSQWSTLNLKHLNPCDWGWKMSRNGLVPIKTDLEVAPEFLLKVIRCNCKTASRNTCGTSACSCKKNGLTCVPACGDCRGVFCNNTLQEEVAPVDDNELEDGNIFDILFD